MSTGRTSNGRDVKAAEQATAGYTDGVLRIEAPAKNRILGSPGSIEVTVQLPAGSRVDAKAASAEFRTVGRLGEVAFDGSQAQVKVDEAATARLTILDGSVTVGRLSGAAEVRTQRGDIEIAEAISGTVVLRTEDGAITVGAAVTAWQPTRSFDLITEELWTSDAITPKPPITAIIPINPITTG